MKGKNSKICTYAMNMSSKYLDLFYTFYYFVYMCSHSECQGFLTWTQTMVDEVKTFYMGGQKICMYLWEYMNIVSEYLWICKY